MNDLKDFQIFKNQLFKNFLTSNDFFSGEEKPSLKHGINSQFRNIPDVQAGFRKGRGTRDQIANICWIIKKARELQKNIYLCFIDYAKAFDHVDPKK